MSNGQLVSFPFVSKSSDVPYSPTVSESQLLQISDLCSAAESAEIALLHLIPEIKAFQRKMEFVYDLKVANSSQTVFAFLEQYCSNFDFQEANPRFAEMFPVDRVVELFDRMDREGDIGNGINQLISQARYYTDLWIRKEIYTNTSR